MLCAPSLQLFLSDKSKHRNEQTTTGLKTKRRNERTKIRRLIKRQKTETETDRQRLRQRQTKANQISKRHSSFASIRTNTIRNLMGNLPQTTNYDNLFWPLYAVWFQQSQSPCHSRKSARVPSCFQSPRISCRRSAFVRVRLGLLAESKYRFTTSFLQPLP